MRSSVARHALVAVLLGLTTTLVLTSTSAQAGKFDTAVQGKSRTETATFRDYPTSGGHSVQQSGFSGGKLRFTVTPFRLARKDGRDHWRLRVRVKNLLKHQTGGGHPKGWAKVYVTPQNYRRITATKYTRSKTTDKKCHSIVSLGIGPGRGFVGVSIGPSLWQLKTCRSASVNAIHHNSTSGVTHWRVNRVRHLRETQMDSFIRVPKGVKPTWKVAIERPLDYCTRRSMDPPNLCRPTDRTEWKRFTVQFTPS